MNDAAPNEQHTSRNNTDNTDNTKKWHQSKRTKISQPGLFLSYAKKKKNQLSRLSSKAERGIVSHSLTT
eukprot:scaffold8005_cov275-Amphora_coffeaeformis.AAC.2